jgi:uncharacterized coiled-coil protein SlyX
VNAALPEKFPPRIPQVPLRSNAAEQETTIRELKSTVARQEAMMAQQQKDFTARLKEQDAKIQKVSDRVELSKSAPRTVDNQ